MSKREGAPGGQMARQHLYDALGGAHIPAHAHRVALVGQVTGEGSGTLGGAGKQGDGVPLCKERVQVLPQGGKVAVPIGAAKASALMRSFSLNSFMPRRKFSHSRVLCFWRR